MKKFNRLVLCQTYIGFLIYNIDLSGFYTIII